MTMAAIDPQAGPAEWTDSDTNQCVDQAQKLRQAAVSARRAAAAARTRGEGTRAGTVRRRMEWFGAPTDDGQLWITHCAWCKRVRTTLGRWIHLPRGLTWDVPVVHTHGICATCAVKWRAAYCVPAARPS
jgi:hypothetical protein